MKPLRTRDELLALAARHAPTRACARAISENRATVLGGFTAPECLPCYIVRVTTYHKKTYHLKIECDEAERRYRVVVIDKVPWEHWAGYSNGCRPLIDGDLPVAWAYEKMRAKHDSFCAKAIDNT